MNEGCGNKIYDLSGNGNTGTFGSSSASPTWLAGKFGSCLYSDGGDYALINDAAILRFTNNFTISFWFRVASTSQSQKYLMCRNNAGAGSVYQTAIIYEYVDNQIEVYSPSYSGTDPRTGSQIPITDTNWHHVVYAYNGSIWCGYKDGILIFSVSRTFSLDVTALTGWFLLTANESFPQNSVNGYLDNIQFFNRGLSIAEVQQLYREPFCMFDYPTSRGLKI